MKIEFSHYVTSDDIAPCLRCIPVVRMHELKRWAEEMSLTVESSFNTCDEIYAYRLALEHLMSELGYKQGGARHGRGKPRD